MVLAILRINLEAPLLINIDRHKTAVYVKDYKVLRAFTVVESIHF